MCMELGINSVFDVSYVWGRTSFFYRKPRDIQFPVFFMIECFLPGMIRWLSWTALVGWSLFVPAASGPIGRVNCAWAVTSSAGSLWVTALWTDGAGDSLCTQSTRPPRRVTCCQTEHCSLDRPLTWSAVFWVSTRRDIVSGSLWCVGEGWPKGYRAGLQTERSGFKPWPGSSYSFFEFLSCY